MKQLDDKGLYEQYLQYIALKKEMDKVYRYKWPRPAFRGAIEWTESTDKLSVIFWKQREKWIGFPELLEEVV